VIVYQGNLRIKEILLGFLAILFLALNAISINNAYSLFKWTLLCRGTRELEIGMSKEEVLSILGKPDYEASAERSVKEHWDVWRYEAFWFAPFLHTSTLYIEFDPNDVSFIEKQPDYPIRFDSEDWKRSTSERRACMIGELLKRHKLVGISKDKIMDLLGEPDAINDFGDWDFAYRLGIENGLFPIDRQWLVIDIDMYGEAERVGIITD
jgi:outer membrane protein assembly factor BamE (lipoprotein component of BamABCDE complex)